MQGGSAKVLHCSATAGGTFAHHFVIMNVEMTTSVLHYLCSSRDDDEPNDGTAGQHESLAGIKLNKV